MNLLAKVDLAHEPDFVLGRLRVSPSRRELVRDDGEREVIEHRVMQVLIALAKARDSIVTRDELTMSCWDGRVVGEDAIHRVLSRLRKVANGLGAGSFEIETITKVGYRLTSKGDEALADGAPVPLEPALAPAGWRQAGRRKLVAVAMAIVLLVTAGLTAWTILGGRASPVIAVGPADASRPSQLLARDLFVKLGTLPQLGSGDWQLVEAESARSTPHLLFRTAMSGPATEPHATLMLLDGKTSNLVWSREFGFPPGRVSDLRQHVSLTAARVLDCALETREASGLPPELFRLFLTGCAALTETSAEEPLKTAGLMRAVVTQRPRFAPAWARLLALDSNVFRLVSNEAGEADGARETLRRDIESARKVAPGLPEIKLAALDLLPPDGYADALELLRELKIQAPEKAEIWGAEANALARVGRMEDAIASARRAAELDPLSPASSRALIFALAWGGLTDAAREELGRAERLWAGTGALRDAQFAFHLRYGEPEIARRITSGGGYVGNGKDPYMVARLDPSAANVDRLLRALAQHKARGNARGLGYAVQALGEFHQVDEALDWLQRFPPGPIAEASYILFRPGLAEVRRDPRFMQVAKRIGLVDYWQKSGRWPDFCLETGLPYDCRQEAARLNSAPAPARPI